MRAAIIEAVSFDPVMAEANGQVDRAGELTIHQRVHQIISENSHRPQVAFSDIRPTPARSLEGASQPAITEKRFVVSKCYVAA